MLNVFSSLTSLETLWLNWNELNILDPNQFSSLYNLKKLFIDHIWTIYINKNKKIEYLKFIKLKIMKIQIVLM